MITAPALFILERQDEVSRRLDTLITTRAVATADGNQEALNLIRENGGIEQTIKLCRKYARLSLDALQPLPPSQYRSSLETLVEYIVTRTN